jgi:predicted nucleic acid-binding protein
MNILIDSCIWYALLDKSDSNYSRAQAMKDYFDIGNIVMVYPVLYETLNTRFVKRNDWVNIFNQYVQKNTTVLLQDEKYKQNALEKTIESAMGINRPMSMVDMCIRMILDDVNIKIDALITFNVGDFIDVCQNKGIELIS